MGTLIVKQPSAPMVFTVRTTNPGVSASNQFRFYHKAYNGYRFDYYIDWGDGESDSVKLTHVGDISTFTEHTYASPGDYRIQVKGICDGFKFANTLDGLKLISVGHLGGGLKIISGRSAFFRCFNCTSFTIGDPDFYSRASTTVRESMHLTFQGLPVVSFNGYFNFRQDVSFYRTFIDCGNLIAAPPTYFVDGARLMNCQEVWQRCFALQHFPPNIFDNALCTNYFNAWSDTSLTQESVDNILISINTSAQSNNLNNGTIGIQNGTSATPSATGQAATDSLRARGWTVILNGY